MQLSPQKLEPLQQLLRMLNHNFEVHQVALEAIMLCYFHQLSSVEKITFLSLHGAFGTKIDPCSDTSIHHDLRLLANALDVTPLLKD